MGVVGIRMQLWLLLLFVGLSALGCCLWAGRASAGADGVLPAPGGFVFPRDYASWQVLGVSQRADNETLRVILGNAVAVAAASNGKTYPWPDGSVLAKVVWKQREDEHWPAALVPGQFVHVEFMFRDSARHAETFGWGWARWKGEELTPYGESAEVAQECMACHEPVADRDYVFTSPAVFPLR